MFTLYDTDMNPIGLCLAPHIAHIKHACQPTAVIVYTGRPTQAGALQVVALDTEEVSNEVSRRAQLEYGHR